MRAASRSVCQTARTRLDSRLLAGRLARLGKRVDKSDAVLLDLARRCTAAALLGPRLRPRLRPRTSAAAAPREPSLSASHSNALNRRHRSAHWLCGGYAAGYAEAIRCAPHSLCRQAMPHSLRCLLCVTARCLTRRARRCSSSRTGGPATRGPATGELRIGYAAGYAVRAA